ECVVDGRNGAKIAIGAAGIASPAQSRGDGEVRPKLPRVADIQSEAVVRTKTASRETERRLGGRKSLAVAGNGQRDGVSRRICAGKRRVPIHRRIDFEEAGKPATLNVVVADAKADDMRAPHFAAVVLELVVALRRALRRQQVRSDGEGADVHANGVVGERSTCSAGSIDNLILELQVRETEGVGE